MYAGFSQFAASDQDVIDNKAFVARGKLTIAVLAGGWRKFIRADHGGCHACRSDGCAGPSHPGFWALADGGTAGFHGCSRACLPESATLIAAPAHHRLTLCFHSNQSMVSRQRRPQPFARVVIFMPIDMLLQQFAIVAASSAPPADGFSRSSCGVTSTLAGGYAVRTPHFDLGL